MSRVYQGFIRKGWWGVLLLYVALVIGAGRVLPRFNIEAGTDVLLDDSDPDLWFYYTTRPDWNYDEYIVVCFHRKDGWFTPEAVNQLGDYAQRLSKLPYAKGVTSITTVPLLRNRPFLLAVPPTLVDENGRYNPKVDLAKAKKELIEHTQARGNLISANGQDVSILVYLDIPEEIIRVEPEKMRLLGRRNDPAAKRRLDEIKPVYDKAQDELTRRRELLVAGIRALAREWSKELDEPVRLAGLPIINVNLVEYIVWDLRVFGTAAGVMFVLALLAVYRKIRWVVLPVLSCLIPVVLVLALMVQTGGVMTVVTSNMPVLLFVLLLPYSVYFVERYRERRALDPEEDAKVTTTTAPLEIWTPCLYSCTTTMAGTFSLMTSGILPVRTFGLMMTIGMAVGLATTMLFLPSSVIPLRGLKVDGAGATSEPRGPLRRLVGLCLRAPLIVIMGSLCLLGVSIWGSTKLRVETKFIDYFWSDSEIYRGLDYIDNRMGGTTPLEVLLRSDKPGFFKTPEGLKAIAAVERFFETVPETGNVRSFKSLIDEARKAGFPFKKEKYEEQLIEFVSNVAKGQVREVCNPDFTIARVLVRMKETAPTLNRNAILGRLREHIKQQPELQGLKVDPTGVFLLYANMLNSLIQSQKETFVIVIISIFVMLVILFRNPLLAIIVLLPQVLPVFVVLGVMGFAGIALDIVTVMIASVAMGVGIDSAIQYAVRYRSELSAAGGDISRAVHRSHATIGRAILIANSIVFAGFLILAASRFVPTVYFGIFTALAMLMGMFASLTTLPSTFVLLKYPRPK